MSKHTIAPYVLLAVYKDDQILMLRRCPEHNFGAGSYSLIGGKVEPGESFAQAIVREAYEEVGITIKEDDLTFANIINANQSDGELVSVCFSIHVWHGEPYNKESIKHDALAWFTFNALPADILPLNRLALEMIRARKPYFDVHF